MGTGAGTETGNETGIDSGTDSAAEACAVAVAVAAQVPLAPLGEHPGATYVIVNERFTLSSSFNCVGFVFVLDSTRIDSATCWPLQARQLSLFCGASDVVTHTQTQTHRDTHTHTHKGAQRTRRSSSSGFSKSK